MKNKKIELAISYYWTTEHKYVVVYEKSVYCTVAYAENFHEGFHSVADGGHLYLVCAVCDVTISRHIHVFKRSLLT